MGKIWQRAFLVIICSITCDASAWSLGSVRQTRRHLACLPVTTQQPSVFSSQNIRETNKKILKALSRIDGALVTIQDFAKDPTDSYAQCKRLFAIHTEREMAKLYKPIIAVGLGVGVVPSSLVILVTSCSLLNTRVCDMVMNNVAQILLGMGSSSLIGIGIMHNFESLSRSAVALYHRKPNGVSLASQFQLLSGEIPLLREKIRGYRDNLLSITPHESVTESQMSLAEAIQIVRAQRGRPHADPVIEIADILESRKLVTLL